MRALSSRLARATFATAIAVASPHARGQSSEASTPAPPSDAWMCPSPRRVEPRFAGLELEPTARVVWTEPELERIAATLARDFTALTGRGIECAPRPARAGDVVLTVGHLPEPLRHDPEAYTIEVFDHVLINGQTERGASCGAARWLQLVTPVKGAEPGAQGGWRVPGVRIEDAPGIATRILAASRADFASPAAVRDAVRRAHLAGYNALSFEDGVLAAGDEVLDAASDEARSRRISLATGVTAARLAEPGEARAALARFSILRVASEPPERATDLAAQLRSLEALGAVGLFERDPFPIGEPAPERPLRWLDLAWFPASDATPPPDGTPPASSRGAHWVRRADPATARVLPAAFEARGIAAEISPLVADSTWRGGPPTSVASEAADALARVLAGTAYAVETERGR